MYEFKLKVIMAERNLSIKDVMEGTGISRNTISNLMNSSESLPNMSNLNKLLIFLNVTPDKLIGRVWNPDVVNGIE